MHGDGDNDADNDEALVDDGDNNEPEAEEADGDVNETKDEIDDYWGEGGGGGVMMIIKGRVTLTINMVKMLHAFLEERGRLYTPITMMMVMMMMMITRMAKTIMMCQC